MTCQHCQTWIGDDEHRCSRCGRRVRSFPGRISPSTYPIAATATAPAYEFPPEEREANPEPEPQIAGQQRLFSQPANPARVIAFDSLTSPAERESIRARVNERPPPLKTETVGLPRPRPRKRDGAAPGQRSLEFLGQQESVGTVQKSLICDAPVGEPFARLRAAVHDGSWILCGCALILIAYRFAGGSFALDKAQVTFAAVALLTVPVLYKALWVFAGVDSPGMRKANLRLVDFDGNPPSRKRRYVRLVGSFLSLLAAGIGVLWAFVDEDRLMWHDHISSTFPTYFED